MYTTHAYYASPVDGNYYPTYVFLEDGQLVQVHFLRDEESCRLVYYPPVPWGAAPNPIDVIVLIDNHISNIVYYQPQSYGTAQLLYCHSNGANFITLMCNIDFQKFLPTTIYSSKESYHFNENNSEILSSPFLEQSPNRFPVDNHSSIPIEIIKSLEAVQQGFLANTSINTNENGYKLTAEDLEGNRIVIEKYNLNGINYKSETIVDSPDLKAQRQQMVKDLRRKGLSQKDIANHLGVSQKTISNDLRELGMS